MDRVLVFVLKYFSLKARSSYHFECGALKREKQQKGDKG
jgi:hypothetical protein